MHLTKLETAILNRIQKDVPLCSDFFSQIASDVESDTTTVIKSITELKEGGIVRNISGIFNAESIGYHTSLVAFRIPDQNLDEAASVINGHPGVSHNYLRDNEYNMWFTLAVPTDINLEKTVQVLAAQCNAADSIILHNEKLYKIGLMLNVGDKNAVKNEHIHAYNESDGTIHLTDREREAVKLLQKDLPLVEKPFNEIIKNNNTDLTGNELIEMGNTFKRRGIMRRYSAVLRHHKAGYNSNAMTVWRPESHEQLDIAAGRFKQEPAISHLYLRTIYPGKWEYPLFAMIHAQSDAELENIITGLASESGIKDYRVLYSLREYKKKRVQYFSDEFNLWSERNLA